ncbi:helix-turn-helix domain-containing protein [Morganella morganii]|uniref:helix-turn-helix domain-containing protein n=1 Tax=Morganella morganii TaxID=582 RepID=UPI0034D3EFF3
MTAISLIVGRKIRELRLHHSLTTRQLAHSAGISQQQMSRYERGVNRIHVDILYRLRLVFGCNIHDFFQISRHQQKHLITMNTARRRLRSLSLR